MALFAATLSTRRPFKLHTIFPTPPPLGTLIAARDAVADRNGISGDREADAVGAEAPRVTNSRDKGHLCGAVPWGRGTATRSHMGKRCASGCVLSG